MSNSSSELTSAEDRLESWKAIASYLKRDVTTVQRWEKREGMPVHRHLHEKAGSVYALRSELDAWVRDRSAESAEPIRTGDAESTRMAAPNHEAAEASPWRFASVLFALLAAITSLTALVLWHLHSRDAFWTNPLTDATFTRLTEIDGSEQAVSISRDGRFVAFLASRDGRVDVWMTQVGTGQFHNLTKGEAHELVNPSVRTLGFSPQGDLVTFWTRRSDASGIGVWAVPILGGAPRPYLEGAAEYDWSADGSRLVFHTPESGDPMFIKAGTDASDTRQIFAAPAGHHSHFVLWAPNRRHIYFVQGPSPERSDIWRIDPAGGVPERMTRHESQVSYPVFLGPRTLAYLATDRDGSGPWLYSMDVDRRISHRVSPGIDRYTSLASREDGRRLVATRASTRAGLWRTRLSDGAVSPGSPIPLSTADGASPRLGPGFLLYVSTRDESDSLWKQQGESALRLWTEDRVRIIGGPAIDLEGRRVAFAVRRAGDSALLVVNTDGTGLRTVGRGLDWQGTPAWSPDGTSLTAAALDGGAPRLFTVGLDGTGPRPFGPAPARDPVWSPDGRFVVFSGADIGTVFPVSAIDRNEAPYPLPPIALGRGARHVRFMPGSDALLMLKGSLRHKDVWLTDLRTGTERRLTSVPDDLDVRDFDISPDGTELVLERVDTHAELVLIDLAP